MRTLTAICFSLIPGLCFAEVNMTCVFDTYTAVYLDKGRESLSSGIAQVMTIKNSETTKETLVLDGKVRATNSTQWKVIESNIMNFSKSHFVGNAGELLTIFHEVGEHHKGLSGSYKASMVESGFYQSGVRYGQCTIN